MNLVKGGPDTKVWFDMDTAAFQLAAALGKKSGDVQFWSNGGWQTSPPAVDPQNGGLWGDSLGSTHHEAGTLFAGALGASVTDADGRFHDVANAYVAAPPSSRHSDRPTRRSPR